MKKVKNVAVVKDARQFPFIYSVISSILLPILGFIFYRPSLHYNFQFDDLANITKLFSIRNSTFQNLFFQSSRWISYWLNTIHYKIGKFDPYSYRLFNVMSHSITSIVIFFLLYYALSGLKKKSFFSENSFLIALITALLFLLHPVQTQTVSYVIQGQLEGLAGFFINSVMLCFLLLSQATGMVKKTLLLILLYLLAAFSCGTKEIAIMSPFLLLTFDWFFIAQGSVESLKSRFFIYLGYFIIIFGFYLYFLKPTFFINLFGLKMEARNNIGNILTENFNDKILPLHFFISQFKVILHYMFIFFWPFNISVEYDWKLVKSFFSLDCLLPFILLCILGGTIIWQLTKDKANVLFFSIIWFFISIAPRVVCPSSELLTDYKTYTGSMGMMFLLALGLVKLYLGISEKIGNKNLFRRENYLKYGFITLIALFVGLMTYERNKVWRSGEEFWANIIKNAPGKARAYNNYAVALSEKGLYKESIPYYEKAIAMDNSYPDPLNNIAVAFSFLGDLDRAIEALKRSIMIQPLYPEAYNNLASFLITKKDYDQAEKALEYALRLRPYYGKAYFNLGKVHLYKNNEEKAFECFKNACTKADLDNETGFQIYGHMAMKLKKYSEAAFALGKLVELQPTRENLFNYAYSLYSSDNNERSVQIYEKLVRAYPEERNAWYNLAEGYLKLNNPQKALYAFKKAEDLKHTVPNLPLRMAYCYKLLNNISETERILKEVIQEPSTPEQFRAIARNELSQLNKGKTSAKV